MDHGEASLIAPDSEVKLLDDTTRGGDQDDAEAIESDPLLRVLRKPANARTDEDLSFICSETANVKFFRQLEDAKLHMELCRHITFQIVQIDESIFVQGEEGTTFYIIYSGAVKVMVQEKDYIRKNSNDVGSCVCVLEDGDSFGELALLGNGLRAATVMTAMPTQLLRVEKEAYDHSLHRLHEAELEERIRFLQRIFIFSHWNDENLRKLSKVLTRKAFVKNSTVLLLSKYDFYHLIDQKTVSMMMAYADKFYLDESAIRSQIKEQSKWESYKKDLLREIRPGGASMSSRARGR